MKTLSLRAGLSVATIGSLALVGGACAKTQSPFVQSQAPSTVSVPSIPEITVPDISGVTTPTSGKSKEVPPKQTTTSVKVATGGEFGGQAYEAMKGKLGDFKALEFTIFFGDQQRAQVQAQDPAKPANVDQYIYQDGEISKPVPVKLSGGGSLEENVFDPSTIAWDQLQSMMDQAKAAIPVEDSKGITHVIIKKNLPFDENTVVDVYVDGGARSDGGYVMFGADGTLKKVYGPT